MMLAHTHLTLEADRSHAERSYDWLMQMFRQFTKRAGQVRCGLAGHNELLQYQPTRLSLQCASCGHQSPGWEVGPARTRPVYAPAPFAPPVSV